MSASSRVALVVLTLGAPLSVRASGENKATTPVTFEKDVAPLLSSRCQPCHYPGGKVYAKLPFDRAETIRALGTKLFTRIKEEKAQALIRAFLAEPATSPAKTVPLKP